jgi:hypothetical protein
MMHGFQSAAFIFGLPVACQKLEDKINPSFEVIISCARVRPEACQKLWPLD